MTHLGNPVTSYSTSPYLLGKLGQPQELDELEVETNIATVALGQCVSTSSVHPVCPKQCI